MRKRERWQAYRAQQERRDDHRRREMCAPRATTPLTLTLTRTLTPTQTVTPTLPPNSDHNSNPNPNPNSIILSLALILTLTLTLSSWSSRQRGDTAAAAAAAEMVRNGVNTRSSTLYNMMTGAYTAPRTRTVRGSPTRVIGSHLE